MNKSEDREKPVEETELIPGIIYHNTPSAKKSEPTEKTSELKLQPGINYWQQVLRDQIDSEKPVEETELIPGIIYKNTPSAKKSEPTE